MEGPGAKTPLVTEAQVQRRQYWPNPVWLNFWLALARAIEVLATREGERVGTLRASPVDQPGAAELRADGANVAIADYPQLFDAIGSAQGGTPGPGQFALPTVTQAGVFWMVRALP